MHSVINNRQGPQVSVVVAGGVGKSTLTLLFTEFTYNPLYSPSIGSLPNLRFFWPTWLTMRNTAEEFRKQFVVNDYAVVMVRVCCGLR
jgi:hypothetical protein